MSGFQKSVEQEAWSETGHRQRAMLETRDL